MGCCALGVLGLGVSSLLRRWRGGIVARWSWKLAEGRQQQGSAPSPPAPLALQAPALTGVPALWDP